METITISLLITKAAQLTLFMLMLSMGLNLTIRQVLYLWSKPGLLLRALVASFVLVPITAIIVAQMFPLSPAVRVGIALMAITPGAPLIYQKVSKMKRNITFAASYQVAVSLSAILVIPFLVAFLSNVYPNQGFVTPLQVFKQVLAVQFIPMAIGLSFRAGMPDLAALLHKFVYRIGNGMLLILSLVILTKGFDAMLDAGMLPILAITLLAAVSLAIGHFLGGKDPTIQASLAIANTNRNAGLALVITVLNFTKAEIAPTIIVYALISALAALVYHNCLRSGSSEVSQ